MPVETTDLVPTAALSFSNRISEMIPTQRLRQILQREGHTDAAPVFDPLSARVAEMRGWEVMKLSGSFGKFANLAVPDELPLTNMSDLVDVARRINRVCDLPLVVDADDGGGNALTLRRTVRELEAAGVAAIEIEDNAVPQCTGHAERRHSLMLSQDEQVGKLRAAVAARRNPDTLIVARTFALSELPRDEALARIRAYSDTGAEALMIAELPAGPEDLIEVAQATHLPLFVLGLPQQSATNAKFMRQVRLKLRFLPHIPFRMALKALIEAYDHLQTTAPHEAMRGREAGLQAITELTRSDDHAAWQERFLQSDI
jgi:carboxyvinyl-carboxyphosphonate phosphorylmutase